MSDTIAGLAFPFRIENGAVATKSGADKLKDNIAHILLTGVGQRVMRRDYGGGLRQLLHDPNNDALRAIVQHQIAKAIGTYEPRVLVQTVDVSQDVAQGVVSVSVQFTVRRTRQVQQLTVPVGLGGT